jgi:hypothetical protein
LQFVPPGQAVRTGLLFCLLHKKVSKPSFDPISIGTSAGKKVTTDKEILEFYDVFFACGAQLARFLLRSNSAPSNACTIKILLELLWISL